MNLLAALWFDWNYDTWPLIMSLLVGLGCGLLGAVFLLRRAALLGDAISHSVLPGIALGLIVFSVISHHDGNDSVFSAGTSLIFILGGAVLAGLLCTLLIQAFAKYSRIKSDAALGSVFPAFFAIGVLMIQTLASGAHFDADCIFYGSLEVIQDESSVRPTIFSTALVVFAFLVFYKEILISSFDDQYTRTLGIRSRLVNTILVALLATTVVCSFEAVGAILVVAFLVIPPATAYLLTDRFRNVLILSSIFGMTAGALGCWLSVVFETSAPRAPTMAIVAGFQFLIALFCAPERGLISQYRRSRALRDQILEENLLGAIYRLALAKPDGSASGAGTRIDLDEAADMLRYPVKYLRRAVRRTTKFHELVDHGDGLYSLTDSGAGRIEPILRAHRLWETYMINEMGVAPDHVHDAADHIEHYLQPTLIEEIDEHLDRPSADPHGKSIPGRDDS